MPTPSRLLGCALALRAAVDPRGVAQALDRTDESSVLSAEQQVRGPSTADAYALIDEVEIQSLDRYCNVQVALVQGDADEQKAIELARAVCGRL